LVAMGFELRASHLIGRASTTWVTPLAPYVSVLILKKITHKYDDIVSRMW
jgi:hypothetical protein